jgi:hypothetical protein
LYVPSFDMSGIDGPVTLLVDAPEPGPRLAASVGCNDRGPVV